MHGSVIKALEWIQKRNVRFGRHDKHFFGKLKLKEKYTTQQNTRSWSGKYFFKSLIWVWNWTRMLKDYSHGQALMVLEGIDMIKTNKYSVAEF